MRLPGRIDLNDLLVFEAVAQAGGFTAAADRLGVATTKVSLEISRLERTLGIALFHRTTRRVALTEAGQKLYEDCLPLLSGLTQAVERATLGEKQLGGTLRISTTVDHAALSLAPALAEFSRQHPRLAIDLRTNDRVADLVEAGIDASIRLGWLRDSSNRAVKLGQFEQFVVASPAYMARRVPPADPEDLISMDWIALTLLPAPLTWTFASSGDKTTTIVVKSRLRVDSPGAMRALLENGAGVSVIDQFSAEAGLSSGRLVRLLPEWTLPVGGVYAVYPPGRQVSAKVRSFIDFYREALRD